MSFCEQVKEVRKLHPVEPRYNEHLYNESLDITKYKMWLIMLYSNGVFSCYNKIKYAGSDTVLLAK